MFQFDIKDKKTGKIIAGSSLMDQLSKSFGLDKTSDTLTTPPDTSTGGTTPTPNPDVVNQYPHVNPEDGSIYYTDTP